MISLPTDRTIPLIVVTSLLAMFGFVFHGERTGEAPHVCANPARVGWQLVCNGQGKSAGAFNLLDGKKIDLNQATASDLMQIPRLQRRVAQAIVELREKLGGRFKSYEQVDQVKGVGEKTLMRLKEWTVLK